MALTINNYLLKDDTILPNAYAKITGINIQNLDYEFYENNPNYENDGIEQFLKYIKRIEANATVFVFSDEVARKNNAYPIDWFNVKFDYNPENADNPFTQVYNYLKTRYSETTDI